jgi:hypothetical protein
MNYRDSERLRKAKWIVNHPYDYTDAEIRKAQKVQVKFEIEPIFGVSTVEKNPINGELDRDFMRDCR